MNINSEFIKKNLIKKRTPELVQNAYRRLAVPNVLSRICILLVVSLNSIIAAKFIGIDAVAAIALLSPIFFFANVLYSLFISGTTSIITRYKSRSENEKASRAFAAILINQFIWVTLIYGLLISFRWQIISLFTNDKELISNAISYFLPYAILQPISLLGNCLEVGFRTDGRAKFFATSDVLNIVLSLIFNLISTLVLNGGLVGLALSSRIAALISLLFSCSHFFSKKCTIKPDFSVLKDRKEFNGYLREELQTGVSLAIDDGMNTLAGFTINKILLLKGGAAAIACYGVYTSIGAMFTAIGLTIENSFYQFSELFYADRDITASKNIFKVALLSDGILGLAFILICKVFPVQIGMLFNVNDSSMTVLLSSFLFWGAISCVIGSFSNIYSAFLIATKRNRLANIFNLTNNLGLICGVSLFGFLLNTDDVMLGKAIAAIIMFIIESIIIYNSRVVFREKDRETVAQFSYQLGEEATGEISDLIYDLFRKNQKLYSSAPKATLMTEECNNLLLYANRGKGKINVDLRVLVFENSYCITIVDDGAIFNPKTYVEKNGNPYEVSLSAKLLKGITPDASYSRVLDLNISHLVYYFREKEAKDEN